MLNYYLLFLVFILIIAINFMNKKYLYYITDILLESIKSNHDFRKSKHAVIVFFSLEDDITFFENKWNENSIEQIFVLLNTPIWKANFVSKRINNNNVEIITNVDDKIIEKLELIQTPYMFEIKNGHILKKGIVL